MPGYDLHTHLAPQPDQIGPADLHRPDKLLRYLDAAGLDTAVVSVPPLFFRQHLSAREAPDWVRTVNDGLLAATAGSDRLLALAYLPLERPELAVTEYQRISADFAGFSGAAGGRTGSLADPLLTPLWTELDNDRRLLMLHPGMTLDSRLGDFYLGNLLGNPSETGVAAAQLVFGGVLARHPGMRVLLVHCGGVVPAVVGRWQRGADTARPGVPDDLEPPAQAVRRFYVDCLAHDEAVVDLAVQVFGEDKLVLGSDWPFPMGCDDPAALVAHRGAAFTQWVAVDNAKSLLGL